jgi:peroxiredoxin
MRFAEPLKHGGGCVLIASLVVPGFFLFNSNAGAQQIGAPAPAWSLPDPDGRTISSANFAGKVVLLSFFTTWCNPCLVEAPELAALQSEYGSAGLAVVGIGVFEDPGAVRSFMDAHGVNYPLAVASVFNPASSGVLADYGVTSVPRSVIIDRNNIVVAAYFNFHNRDYFREKIAPLLAPGPPQLAFQRSGRNLVLSWSTNAAGYVLQTSTNTSSTSTWSSVATGISLTNGLYRITWPFSSGNRYFRLRR